MERTSDTTFHEIKRVSDIEELLLKLIKNGCGRDPGYTPTSETVPMSDIHGFDSLTALEVLTELEEATGIDVSEEIFYVDLKPKRYLPIRSIAAAIWDQLNAQRSRHA